MKKETFFLCFTIWKNISFRPNLRRSCSWQRLYARNQEWSGNCMFDEGKLAHFHTNKVQVLGWFTFRYSTIRCVVYVWFIDILWLVFFQTSLVTSSDIQPNKKEHYYSPTHRKAFRFVNHINPLCLYCSLLLTSSIIDNKDESKLWFFDIKNDVKPCLTVSNWINFCIT